MCVIARVSLASLHCYMFMYIQANPTMLWKLSLSLWMSVDCFTVVWYHKDPEHGTPVQCSPWSLPRLISCFTYFLGVRLNLKYVSHSILSAPQQKMYLPYMYMKVHLRGLAYFCLSIISHYMCSFDYFILFTEIIMLHVLHMCI